MTEGNKKRKKENEEEEDAVPWGTGDEKLLETACGAAPSENDD